jgi:phosphatidylserine decarboxylase
MAKPLPLPVWDRRSDKLVMEWMGDHQTTYESRPRASLAQWIKSHPLFDWAYAAYQNTGRSARQIEPFVREYHIDMSEFEPVRYRSFAEFFDRRFRPGVRKFPSAPGGMGAFAEARYLAWDKLDPGQTFPVKGHSLDAEQILGQAARARPFIDGPVLLARLAPVDYHHALPGPWHDLGSRSARRPPLDRQLACPPELAGYPLQQRTPDKHPGDTQLRTARIRGGGGLIGRKNRSSPSGRSGVPTRRGKVGLPLRRLRDRRVRRTRSWQPADDLIAHTKEGVETFVRLGEPVGLSPTKH